MNDAAGVFEVELKFPIVDPADFRARAESLSAQPVKTKSQCDAYFAHPGRDFGESDEALRIRESSGTFFLTYKGPKVDAVSKTREEIEFPLAANSARGLDQVLQRLGFESAGVVRKTRDVLEMKWRGWPIEIAVDNVDGLGSFVELETQASDAQRDAARDALLELASELGLENSIRKSYLCLMMESERPGTESKESKNANKE